MDFPLSEDAPALLHLLGADNFQLNRAYAKKQHKKRSDTVSLEFILNVASVVVSLSKLDQKIALTSIQRVRTRYRAFGDREEVEGSLQDVKLFDLTHAGSNYYAVTSVKGDQVVTFSYASYRKDSPTHPGHDSFLSTLFISVQ